MKICIDPGHRNSVYDFGATSNQAKESALALQLALLLGKGFEQAGHEVHYTRTSEEQVISLEKRVQAANQIKGLDYFISMHLNSFSDENSNGFEVWHYGNQEALAESICTRACEATGFTNRGAKVSTDFYVLRKTYCNAVLIENGFISNANERAKLSMPDFQLKLVNAILKAFNVAPMKTESSAVQKPAANNKTKLLLNHQLKEVEMILKDGCNYVKLRDLADAHIEIGYDSAQKLPSLTVKTLK